MATLDRVNRIPLEVRKAAARLTILALVEDVATWSPEYLEDQIANMAEWHWGGELCDATCCLTHKMCNVLRQFNEYGNNIASWE